ncbi:MAG: 50S ribosomal protein L17 [Dehalococcoidia bacterium]
MRHRVAGRHLGRSTAHRRALFRNLVTDFLRYERIRTTEAKAKEVRPLAEKMITLAKRGDLHSRRQALRFVYDARVVKRTFEEIAPRMADRPGGYTRITSLEPRKGDGARMAVLEMVDLDDVAMPRPERATAAPTAGRDPEAAGEETDAAPAAADEIVEEAEAEDSEETGVPEDAVAEDAVAAEADDGAAHDEADVVAEAEETETGAEASEQAEEDAESASEEEAKD